MQILIGQNGSRTFKLSLFLQPIAALINDQNREGDARYIVDQRDEKEQKRSQIDSCEEKAFALDEEVNQFEDIEPQKEYEESQSVLVVYVEDLDSVFGAFEHEIGVDRKDKETRVRYGIDMDEERSEEGNENRCDDRHDQKNDV